MNSPKPFFDRHRRATLFLLGAGLLGFACGSPLAPSVAPTKPPTTPTPDAKKGPMKCNVCGMHVDPDSENRFELTDAKEKKHDFCSSVCAIAYSDAFPTGAITVYDYETHKQIPAATAFHLYGSKLDVAGAMPPTVAAFGNRAKADEFAKKKGGKVLNWDDLRTAIRKTDDYKDSRIPKEKAQVQPAVNLACRVSGNE